jgi:large subunit ribosomal protein L16
MMSAFIPRKRKFRKAHVGVNKGLATSRTYLAFGNYGLRVLEPCDIKVNQLESARIAARKGTGKEGKIFWRVHADLPKSKKPLEVRMGSGKGAVDHFVARVKPGTVVMEIGGVNRDRAFAAFKRASHKLPIKTAFVQHIPVCNE